MKTPGTFTGEPRWTNQDLILYHGTIRPWAELIRYSGVQVKRGRQGTDFGQGFYCTTVARQAEQWAQRLAKRRREPFPAVLQFSLRREDIASLETLSFVNGDADAHQLWGLIDHCRTNGRGHARWPTRSNTDGFYDVVFGPVAANWDERRCIPSYDQVSFHTLGAEKLLNAQRERSMIVL